MKTKEEPVSIAYMLVGGIVGGVIGIPIAFMITGAMGWL